MRGQTATASRFWPVMECDRAVSVSSHDMPQSLYASLCAAQKKWPDRACMVDTAGISYTYSQLLDMTDCFSEELFRNYGVRPGMQIGVLLYDSIAFCVSIYALNRLRAVAVPLPVSCQRQELFALIGRTDLDGLIFHRDFLQWFPIETGKCFLLCLRETVPELFQDTVSDPALPEQDTLAEDPAILLCQSAAGTMIRNNTLTNRDIMQKIAVRRKAFQTVKSERTIFPVPDCDAAGRITAMGLFLQAGGCIWLRKSIRAVCTF